MSGEPSPAALEACRAAFRNAVASAYREDFGVSDPAQVAKVTESWFSPELHDGRFEHLSRRLPGPRRVLDLASGMGTAVLRGVALGHDAFGIEPDAEKLALCRRRVLSDPDLDPAFAGRFVRAVGERLPFKDGAFDAVLSHQTLEHVQDVDAVLAEMLRVVKSGGGLHIRCPDYRGTFEGHYLLPWLPLMPRPLARLWLRLRGRPDAGLRGIRYTTFPGLARALRRAARRAGREVRVVDLEGERARERLRGFGIPAPRAVMPLLKAAQWARRLFRAESEIHLWATID